MMKVGVKIWERGHNVLQDRSLYIVFNQWQTGNFSDNKKVPFLQAQRAEVSSALT